MASSEGKKCQPFTFTNCKEEGGGGGKHPKNKGGGAQPPAVKTDILTRMKNRGLGLEYFLEVLERVEERNIYFCASICNSLRKWLSLDRTQILFTSSAFAQGHGIHLRFWGSTYPSEHGDTSVWTGWPWVSSHPGRDQSSQTIRPAAATQAKDVDIQQAHSTGPFTRF